jgi:AcrR family transcriptional regulator
MTAVKRGRPRDEAIDAAILAAAVDELTERGFLSFTMEAVAARAGVAKTTVYRRWPGGTHELAVEAMRSLRSAECEEPPAGSSARDELLYLLDGMRRTWTDERYAMLMRRVSADGSIRPEEYRSVRDRLVAPHVNRLTQAVQRARDEGLIRPDVDLVWVRQLLTAPILAAAFTHRDRVTRAELAFTVDTVLRGLAP